MKLYLLRTEDVILASSQGYLPEGSLCKIGSLWCEAFLTEAEAKEYPFPIQLL